MTTLQLVIVIIGGILVLFFLFAFLLPSRKTLEWSLEIKADAEKIFNLVSDFSNYKKWNPWSAREPEAHGEMSGTPRSVGHKWLWDGKVIGRGYLQIREIEKAKSIVSDLVFEKPRKMESLDTWKFEDRGNGTTLVTWGHTAFLGYPMGRIFGLMLNKMLGKDFEQGLQNLKKLSEG